MYCSIVNLEQEVKGGPCETLCGRAVTCLLRGKEGKHGRDTSVVTQDDRVSTFLRPLLCNDACNKQPRWGRASLMSQPSQVVNVTLSISPLNE